MVRLLVSINLQINNEYMLFRVIDSLWFQLHPWYRVPNVDLTSFCLAFQLLNNYSAQDFVDENIRILSFYINNIDHVSLWKSNGTLNLGPKIDYFVSVTMESR